MPSIETSSTRVSSTSCSDTGSVVGSPSDVALVAGSTSMVGCWLFTGPPVSRVMDTAVGQNSPTAKTLGGHPLHRLDLRHQTCPKGEVLAPRSVRPTHRCTEGFAFLPSRCTSKRA